MHPGLEVDHDTCGMNLRSDKGLRYSYRTFDGGDRKCVRKQEP